MLFKDRRRRSGAWGRRAAGQRRGRGQKGEATALGAARAALSALREQCSASRGGKASTSL
eukprot:scaffold31771_cov129-Isochrysis_galbana.AAC.1